MRSDRPQFPEVACPRNLGMWWYECLACSYTKQSKLTRQDHLRIRFEDWLAHKSLRAYRIYRVRTSNVYYWLRWNLWLRWQRA